MSGAASDDLGWRALGALSWDEAADIFNRSYAGYVIPVHASGSDLAARCLAEDIDPLASYVFDDRSGPVGIGLIARRGSRGRLAALAVVPRVRGHGVARPALARLVEESRRRGDETLELEVFEHNMPAVRLYEGFGFRPVDRLLGFVLDPGPAGQAGDGLPAFPLDELAGNLAAQGDQGLPWQLQPETISRIGGSWQVMGDGEGAFALVDFSRSAAVTLRLLFTLPQLRRAGRARGLLAAIRVRAGGRPVHVPQLIPERHAAFAHALGFAAAGNPQLRMVLAHAS